MTAGFRLGVVAAALVAVILGLPWDGAVQPASAQAVSVNGASPSTAAQGTSNLNVTISGKNFKAGATVVFYRIDTQNTGGVIVTTTTYKRSSQLIATINVPEAAERGSYDIKVTVGTSAATGRALFSVTPKPVDPCTSDEPVPATADTSGDPGSRDATFGAGAGVVIGPKFMELGGAAIDGAGRSITVGSSYDGCAHTDSEWTIVRYLATGELDNTFGVNGVVTKKFQRSSGWLHGVAIDPQGRIVVAGYLRGKPTGNVGVVARYTPEGMLDTNFAKTGIEPGIRSLSLERYMTDAKAVAIQSDGKIVVAGTDGGSMAVFRLNDDGTLDTAGFNSGAVAPQLPGRYVYTLTPSYGFGIAIQTVGREQRIVVAGRAGVMRDGVGHIDGAAWRFTSGGVPDPGFGASGLVTTDFYGGDDVFQTVVIDPSNRIVVAGSANEGPDYSGRVAAVLVRYGIAGDANLVTAAPNRVWAHYPYAIAIDASGNILVGGYAVDRDAGNVTVKEGTGLWRFTPVGDLDVTFGADGWVFDSIAEGDRYPSWRMVAVRPDGKILAAGTFSWGASYPALARFWQ